MHFVAQPKGRSLFALRVPVGLYARNIRPCRCSSAEKRDELAPPHRLPPKTAQNKAS
jgi:hypothetical protein